MLNEDVGIELDACLCPLDVKKPLEGANESEDRNIESVVTVGEGKGAPSDSKVTTEWVLDKEIFSVSEGVGVGEIRREGVGMTVSDVCVNVLTTTDIVDVVKTEVSLSIKVGLVR